MNIAIVVPVYNDWEPLIKLLEAINLQAARLGGSVNIFVVDDGSTSPRPSNVTQTSLTQIKQACLIELTCNLGHQRAIAVGLAHLNRMDVYDVVIVMDSDGEDRPEDLPALLEAYREHPDAIVVAQRAQRSEGVSFAIFYFLYKRLFRLLTGCTIDFGNFCLLPKNHLARLVYMSELWNHLAATILLSRIPVYRLKTLRGVRYAGRSSMKVISLITHGLSAIGAFADLLFVRLLVVSLIFTGLGALVAIGATVIRLSTNLAIPGWATTVVGLAVVIIVQGLTLSTAAFMTLSARKNLPFVPAANSFTFIRAIRTLASSGGIAQ
jgi:glycosyltransferase involved in cell wall biosynthesis